MKSFSSPRIRMYQRGSPSGVSSRVPRSTAAIAVFPANNPLRSHASISAPEISEPIAGVQVTSFADDELAGREVGVDPPQSRRREAPRVALGACRRRDRHRRRQQRVVEDASDRRCELAWDRAGGSGSRSRRRRRATGAHPPRSATTGMPHAAASSATSPKLSLRLGTMTTSAAAVVRRQDVVRLRRHEPHAVVEPELVDQLMGPVRPRRRLRCHWHRRRSTAARRGDRARAAHGSPRRGP